MSIPVGLYLITSLLSAAPTEPDPLSLVGPDGIEYPFVGRAGVQGGIPDLEVVARVRDFGAIPDDGKDDRDAIERAAAAAGERGGGAVLFEPGTYEIEGFVIIRRGGVVLRGAGRDRTRIICRARAPEGLRFLPLATLPDGSLAGRTQVNVFHPEAVRPRADRARVVLAEGEIDGKRISLSQSGETKVFFSRASIDARRLAPGPHTLRVRVHAPAGDVEDTWRFRVAKAPGAMADRLHACNYLGAISFLGSAAAQTVHLARDGRRGDVSIELADTPAWKAGDFVMIEGPNSERWRRETGNACTWGVYRRGIFRILGVEGRRVRLNQPLRIPYPAADGSYAQRIFPIRRVGVESMTLTHANRLWYSTIIFSYAVDGWVRDVRVEKTGRFAAYPVESKWCEIRDCEFIDCWNKGGGGTGYVGFERSYDCLFTDSTVRAMRHAPQVQWSAAGCVLRASRFDGSDGQLHSGYCHDNLFEENEIRAAGYGHGFWASPSTDQVHGPTGPRNVIRHSTIEASKNGIWLGGKGDDWIIAYNHFRFGGYGIEVVEDTGGHRIVGNAFESRGGKAVLRVRNARSRGIELRGNRIRGTERLVEGEGAVRTADNEILAPAAPIEVPRTAVDSVYLWQRRWIEGRDGGASDRERP